MSPTNTLAIFVIFCVISSAFASDPDAAQDLCVALLSSDVRVNGFPCKEWSSVTEADFFFDGLAKGGDITNSFGSVVTSANVKTIPGLNTFGISLARTDYKAGGLNPPHTHTRATEVVFVLDGQLDVGFITNYKLISKSIKKGEIFVFPKGLVHYLKSTGDKPASVLSAFSSQLHCTVYVASALFASTPTVPDDVLSRSFLIDVKQVDDLKAKFAS